MSIRIRRRIKAALRVRNPILRACFAEFLGTLILIVSWFLSTLQMRGQGSLILQVCMHLYYHPVTKECCLLRLQFIHRQHLMVLTDNVSRCLGMEVWLRQFWVEGQLAPSSPSTSLGVWLLPWLSGHREESAVSIWSSLPLFTYEVTWNEVTLPRFVVFLTGGHVNPAVTLTFCLMGRLPWRMLIPYWLGQYMGAFVGSACIYGVYVGE